MKISIGQSLRRNKGIPLGSMIPDYLDAHSGLSQDERSALLTFVGSLVDAGIWESLSVGYPCIGSTYNDIRLELKTNPVGWAVATNPGVGSNRFVRGGSTSSSRYGPTDLLGLIGFDFDDHTVAFSGRQVVSGINFWVFNIFDAGATPQTVLRLARNQASNRYLNGYTQISSTTGGNITLLIGTSKNGTHKLYHFGTETASGSYTKGSNITTETLGVRFRDCELYSSWLFNRELNAIEVMALSQAMDALDIALGR